MPLSSLLARAVDRWRAGLPALLLLVGLAAHAQPVRHYDLQIEPDLATGQVQGHLRVHVERLQLAAPRAGHPALALDAGELVIDSVQEQGRTVPFQKSGRQLLITPAPAPDGSADRVFDIEYHGRPAAGLTVATQEREVFTAFATSDWMPCLDAPSARASLRLALRLPDDLVAAAVGSLQLRHAQPGGKTLWVWAQTAPVPCYLFGFAAGPFRELVDDSAAPTLRVLGPAGFSTEELRRIFRDTRDMIAFYEEKAGMPYPGETYTQVLVSGKAAQELAGMAVLGQAYGRRVLADPRQTWLGAHELSHQWWGNAVTNRAWTEFWLNEGLACFINAAYFEHRHGAAAYREYIEAAQRQYEAVRSAGADRSLVFPDWQRPSAQDRSLVYDKGAYLLHLLRERMGDTAFWTGWRRFTQQHWGRAVSTQDFQAAMQAASSVDLEPFFAAWVYRTRP